MKILCLFVQHGASKYPEARASLDQWYARQGLLERRILWTIDNQLVLDQPPITQPNGESLRPGDNRAWEFSSWAEALRQVQQEQINCDLIHFVTSAFQTLYTGYLHHFRADMLDYLTSYNVCLGHIDSYDLPIEIAGQSSQAWIRTCFFFLSSSVAHSIPTWVAFDDPVTFFPETDSTVFRETAPLSRDYQKNIRGWLEGREAGGHRWHSPIRDGKDEARRFQQKTLAILNEHYFSITLRRLGIPLVDYCWLWSLEQAGFEPIPPASENQQLGVRRRILGITS